MDTLLILTGDDRLFFALEAGLRGYYAIQRAQSIQTLQPLVDSGHVSVLFLDCPADVTLYSEFLRQNELTHPYLECLAIMNPESFCRMALSKSHNLFALLRPVETEDMIRVLRDTKSKLARAAIFYDGSDPMFVRQQERRFWLTLIHSSVPEGGPISEAPPPINFSFRLDQRIFPVLICFRGWRQPHSRREQEVLRFGLHALLEQLLPQQYGGVTLTLDEESCLVILYGDALPVHSELEQVCQNIIHIAEQGLHCNVACYCGEPCHIHQIAAQVQILVGGDRNNVVVNQGIFPLARLQQARPALTAPMPQDWMIYFTQGRLGDFCRCIDEFFQQAIAANTLDRDFLTCFQQDMVQELSFALKSAGVPARRLLHGMQGAEEMRDAVRSVTAMKQWIRKVAEEAMILTGAASENPDLVQVVLQYIQVNIERPISRADLSDLLHLSQGHIARVFRQEMGMSLSDYITQQRMEMARRMLIQSELPPGTVAERCGFNDYPYFYKTFKKHTGLSPSAYRSQMQK